MQELETCRRFVVRRKLLDDIDIQKVMSSCCCPIVNLVTGGDLRRISGTAQGASAWTYQIRALQVGLDRIVVSNLDAEISQVVNENDHCTRGALAVNVVSAGVNN